ncbi:hypothetical protein DRO21_03520 [archaeon]|nr:MAG: hypothetical protein DRO21_03520 [archaeon]
MIVVFDIVMVKPPFKMYNGEELIGFFKAVFWGDRKLIVSWSGTLYITNRRLVFAKTFPPWDKETLEWPLYNIVDVIVQKLPFSWSMVRGFDIAASLSKGIFIKLSDDKEIVFTCVRGDPEYWRDFIREAVYSVRDG